VFVRLSPALSRFGSVRAQRVAEFREGFAVILFLAGLILYFDGLVQERKSEKEKKQATVASESTIG
jgi:hypothetical protein